MLSRSRYDKNKNPKIKRKDTQTGEEGKTNNLLHSEKLYNYGDSDVGVFHDLSEFLSQEIMLMKSENIEKVKNCEIEKTKENITSLTNNYKQFSKESVSNSQKFEEQRNEFNKKISNKIVNEIYSDFSEIENDNYVDTHAANISEINFRRIIKKTYSNKKLKMQCYLAKENVPTGLVPEILPHKSEDIDPSEIDIILSQSVSENLLRLSSYFMSTGKSDAINENKKLETSLDLQRLFNRGNASFFGRLVDPESFACFNTEPQKVMNVGISKNKVRTKYQNTFSFGLSNHFEKKDPQLFKMKEFPSSPSVKNIRFQVPKMKTQPNTKNFSDHSELWPDEDLLQNILIGEAEKAIVGSSNSETKVNINFCNNASNKTQSRRSNIETSNFSLKRGNYSELKRKSLDLKSNSIVTSSEIEEDMPEFLTASQKKIHISHEALLKAKSLIQFDPAQTDELNKF